KLHKDRIQTRLLQGTIEYHLQQVKNTNLKWRELPSTERHAYCERVSRLPRVPSWTLFYDYNIKETLKDKMKYEYLHDDGDIFVYYSWERAFSIYGDVYPEWLCGVKKVLTSPEFVVFLRLYEEDELNHGLFAIHFTKLEVDDKLFNHEEFWQKIGKPTSTNSRTSLIKEPLMRIVHKLLVGSLVHRAISKESLIYGGHYVTKIAHSLGYLNEEEVSKCLEPIECETWTVKMLENELDEGNHTLMQTEQEAPRHGQARRERQEPRGLDSSSIVPSSGYEIRGHQQDSMEKILIRLCIRKIVWRVTMMKCEIDRMIKFNSKTLAYVG
ncbi:hypothetical protein Tco_1179114, partial [Tanacetum coccineum]